MYTRLKQPPKERRGKRVDVTKDFSLCPIEITVRGKARVYIEWSVLLLTDNSIRARWRRFVTKRRVGVDNCGSYYRDMRHASSTIRAFVTHEKELSDREKYE
jgi:hypothetical protein